MSSAPVRQHVRRQPLGDARRGTNLAPGSVVTLRWTFLLPLALLALIFAVDAMLSRYSPPLPLRALLDDSAHLATVALILLAVPRRLPRSFWIGGLLGSVVLDVDQVPQVFGIYWPPVVGRPYPHSLLAVLLVTLVLCRLVPGNQALVFGLACGLLSHLARDVATGLTPVFWPLMISQVAVPYAVYAAGIAVTTGWVAYREVAQGPDRAARSVLSQIRPQRG